MFTIEIALRHTPIPVFVHRKEAEAAEDLYRTVVQHLQNHIQTGERTVLELTCEKMEGKHSAIVTSEILAVQMLEKSSATTNSGAGFIR
ncbi:MAG: hypothetical protein HC918_03105 [Oscillatoriales cyanobacterium SM2_1_8]|nr:hypothetical protein [Oscillatoriales cyanobacterium SM2_1_8]